MRRGRGGVDGMALMAARRTIAAVKTFLIYINAEQKGMLPATSSSNHLSPCLPFLIVCGIIYLYQRERENSVVL